MSLLSGCTRGLGLLSALRTLRPYSALQEATSGVHRTDTGPHRPGCRLSLSLVAFRDNSVITRTTVSWTRGLKPCSPRSRSPTRTWLSPTRLTGPAAPNAVSSSCFVIPTSGTRRVPGSRGGPTAAPRSGLYLSGRAPALPLAVLSARRHSLAGGWTLTSVVPSDDRREYEWEYGLVSATCSSLQFASASTRSRCRQFQLRTVCCRGSARTFNPKVAGSKPARPNREPPQIGGSCCLC